MEISTTPSGTSPMFQRPAPERVRAAARATNSVALLDVSAAGRVTFATGKASALLQKYLSNPNHLPESLVRCLRRQPADGSMLLVPWVAEGGEVQLAIRLTGNE